MNYHSFFSICQNKIMSALVVLFMLVSMVRCAAEDNQSEAMSPELPPEDTLFFPEFKAGETTRSLNPSDGTKQNVAFAATSVVLVTIAVNAVLFIPRALFAGVLTIDPIREGDDWVWEKEFPALGVNGALYGRVDNKLILAMHVTGLRENLDYLDDYVWYSGEHKAESGQWKIFNPGTKAEPGPKDEVVLIDWQRIAEDDKKLVFSNVQTNSLKYNDTLTYALKQKIASMSIHDEMSGQNDDGPSADFSVVWHVDNGSGSMTSNQGMFCWDNLDAGQVDMDCPQDGNWPLP